MRITVPDYYKKFKCIDRFCEDTCCAGWEVEVDEDKFHYYKTVSGEIGKRLKDVMIPMEDGGGCFFRLKEDKRCPFLNEEMLCDIYTELGEESLCETCTDFPRFKNFYGAVKEIGIAPSCFTAAQIMVNAKEPARLESHEDGDMNIVPNDIDPEVFLNIKRSREEIFDILWEKQEQGGYTPIEKTLAKILEKAKETQIKLTGYSEGPDEGKEPAVSESEDIISLYLEPFEGMEIINKDWIRMIQLNKKLTGDCPDAESLHEEYNDYEKDAVVSDMALRQLVFYYIYRFFLESVYDLDPVNAVKTGIVAFLCCKRLCVALYHQNKHVSPDDIADIFHLYSRQLEHSQINFDHYMTEYKNNSLYSCAIIEKLL